MAAVILALFGAAVVCLIGAASIFGSNGNTAWALFCLGMAVVFSVLGLVLWQRQRAASPVRPNQQINDEIRRAAREALKERRSDPPPDPVSTYAKDVLERSRRALLLHELRAKFIRENTRGFAGILNLTEGILSGKDPLPTEWVERELQRLGETWRQVEYF
jgi:hypothetical protein